MNILDKRFKYVNSAATDIRETFKRVRREQEKAKKLPAQVTPFRKVTKGVREI